eukprot:2205368-Prymnesium_polylepis.1
MSRAPGQPVIAARTRGGKAGDGSGSRVVALRGDIARKIRKPAAKRCGPPRCVESDGQGHEGFWQPILVVGVLQRSSMRACARQEV